MTAEPSRAPSTAPLPSRQGRPPRLRAGDQDRHEAVLALSDHFADGRLDQDEFDHRQTAALTAVYLDELDPLFADLPTARRSQAIVPPPRAYQHGRRPGPPRGFLRVAAIVAFVWLVVMTRGLILLVIVGGFWYLHARRHVWEDRTGWDRGKPPWDRRRRW